MGNRAVITTEARDLGVYVHWNGGRDSIEAFLTYCKLRNFRTPESDCYGWARLCQVLGNFFGADGLSVGIERYTTDDAMDPGDNNIYIIRNWEIVDRYPAYMRDETIPTYAPHHDLDEMLRAIDEAQPENQRLGHEFLDAHETDVCELNVGDIVFVPSWGSSPYDRFKIIGFGEQGRIVNGHRVGGVPMIARYTDDYGGASTANPNNYLFDRSYRTLKGSR